MDELIEVLQSVFARPLITLGGTPVTLWSLIYVVALIVALFVVAGWLRHLVSGRLLKRSRLDSGARQAAGAITRYVVLLTGLLVIIQTVGIDIKDPHHPDSWQPANGLQQGNQHSPAFQVETIAAGVRGYQDDLIAPILANPCRLRHDVCQRT